MTALATIHVGLKQLGIEGDDARDLYERQTGKRSLREMSPRQHDAVIGELRRLGFRSAPKAARKRLEGKFAGKLQALWIAGWNLGVVRDRDDKALVSFVQRQTGLETLRFLHHPEDASKAIDGLKAWLAREGGVDWSKDKLLPGWLRRPGAKVAMAQWSVLARSGTVSPEFDAFRSYVAEQAGRALGDMSPKDWTLIMNRLGEKVRRVKHGRL